MGVHGAAVWSQADPLLGSPPHAAHAPTLRPGAHQHLRADRAPGARTTMVQMLPRLQARRYLAARATARSSALRCGGGAPYMSTEIHAAISQLQRTSAGAGA